MIINHSYRSDYSLSRLTCFDINEHIKKIPYLIIPLGGMEPFGSLGSFGVNLLCIDALAVVLSQALKILVAPVIPYGCTTSYKSFRGAMGLKPKIFSRFLSNLCDDCFFQGFQKLVLLNSIEENNLALELLTKRYNNHEIKIETFSLQSDNHIRTFVTSQKSGIELGRSEYMMLSMAAFLQPEFLKTSQIESKITLPDSNVYAAWKKRGRDPEKFKKLFPSGSSSTIAYHYDAKFGSEVFKFISDLLFNQYSSLIKK